MAIEIYHSNNTRDSGMGLWKHFTAADALEAFKSDDGYTVVAVCKSNDLDDAYMLTQNIDTAWTNNDGISPIGSNLRSSMVGDIFETPDGSLYIVDNIGFEKIG